MKRPLYIGFGSQKGGVGKSTIAEIMASVLHYHRHYNLLVIDCDETQNSFSALRKRDHFILTSENKMGQSLKEVFTSYGRKAYSVVSANVTQAKKLSDKLCKELGDIDIVFFDLPGRMNTAELLMFSLSLDYIITPIEPDIQSMSSSLIYASTLQESRSKLNPAYVKIKDILVVWNKVNRSVRKDTIDTFSPMIRDLKLNLLDSMLYASKKFSLELGEARDIKEVFRCSYLAPSLVQMEGTGLREVIDEIEEKIIKPNIK